jgi:hypothetical protein
MINLCPPAIIYLIFSITQILIDTYKGLYNTAFMKVIVASMVTLLLNILCEKGLGVVSWIIVFIPFILMTVIVTFLLYFFGLNASTGTFSQTINPLEHRSGVSTDSSGNIIIYDPEYNPSTKPVYFQSPNIIVPNPSANDPKKITTPITQKTYNPIPNGSSSPAYQS